MFDRWTFAKDEVADAPRFAPLVALVVGFAAYWFPLLPVIGSCAVGSWANIARCTVLFLLGMAAGVLRWKKVSRYGVMGLMGGWVLDVVLSVQMPTVFHCSHQLLPFEGAVIYGVTALCAWFGYLGMRFVGSQLAPGFVGRNKRSLAYTMLALGALIAPVSPLLLPLELRAKEQAALTTLQMLMRQQTRYQALHAQTGYACQFGDLSSELSNTGHSSEKRKNYEYAIRGGYTYRLWCVGDAPRNAYFLEAFPTCVPSCGNIAFCTNESGLIKSVTRSANRKWDKDCWKDGVELTPPESP